MRSLKLYWAAVPVLVLAACSSSHSYKETADVTPVEKVADSGYLPGGPAGLTAPQRKRMRTADIRMRVSNVHTATEKIEKLVRSLDGVVEESLQRNEYHSSREVRYTADSIKRVQLYSTTSDLKLRVPVMQLDSVVYTLSSIALFIDRRSLADQDATLQYLANELKNKPAGAVVPLTRNDKAIDVMDRQQLLDGASVDRKIANLQILDNVAYATITVQLLQPELADIQVLVNPAAVARTGFGENLLNALRNGLTVVAGLLVALLSVWPLWLLLAAGWLVYRKFRKTAVM